MQSIKTDSLDLSLSNLEKEGMALSLQSNTIDLSMYEVTPEGDDEKAVTEKMEGMCEELQEYIQMKGQTSKSLKGMLERLATLTEQVKAIKDEEDKGLKKMKYCINELADRTVKMEDELIQREIERLKKRQADILAMKVAIEESMLSRSGIKERSKIMVNTNSIINVNAMEEEQPVNENAQSLVKSKPNSKRNSIQRASLTSNHTSYISKHTSVHNTPHNSTHTSYIETVNKAKEDEIDIVMKNKEYLLNWSGYHDFDIIFDSNRDNATSPDVFSQGLAGKSNLCFIVSTTKGELFGGIVSSKITPGVWIDDKDSFVFSLESNDRLKKPEHYMIKSELSANSFYLPSEGNYLFVFGNFDIAVSDFSSSSPSKYNQKTFDYQSEDNILVGESTFYQKRLLVLQMK